MTPRKKQLTADITEAEVAKAEFLIVHGVKMDGRLWDGILYQPSKVKVAVLPVKKTVDK